MSNLQPDPETNTPDTQSAFEEGKQLGLYLGSPYSHGMNPYTSYAPGIDKYRAWKAGYKAGVTQHLKDKT